MEKTIRQHKFIPIDKEIRDVIKCTKCQKNILMFGNIKINSEKKINIGGSLCRRL